MPTAEEKRRKVKYYRTIKLPGGKYKHIAIVKKAGPKGGHTVAGPTHKKKKAPDWDAPRREVDDYLRE